MTLTAQQRPPVDVQQHLDFCKAHRVKLLTALETGVFVSRWDV